MASNPEFAGIPWAGPASSGKSRAGLGPMRYITWHATANPSSTARGEAAWARNRTDGVGTHAVADAVEGLQTQVTTLSVGHVGSGTGNRFGIAIECCGVNADTAAHWRPVIDQAAAFARAAMAKHGIANRWLTIAQMRDGVSTGHITHDMARLAWGGTDHTDPGPNFPKDHVITAIAGGTTEDDMNEDQDQRLRRIELTLGWFIQGAEKTGLQPGLGAATFPIVPNLLLKSIAARVDIDPAELAAIEAAAKAGAASSADDIVAGILAGLPEGTLTQQDVETAVRKVLGGLDGATPAS